MDGRRLSGLAMALASGVLYGSINIAAKPVALHPAWLAALMYLTSSLVLAPFGLRLRIKPSDWPKVLAMGLLGGGVAPLFLLYGLQTTAASDAGLLLTMELVATAAFAMLFLRERYRGREWPGLVALLLAAILVAFASQRTGDSSMLGAALVLAGAITWGIDNTVSARLVGSYAPQGLLSVKGLLGGSVALVALAITQPGLPSTNQALAGAGLGVASIAFSSLLFYNALKRVGAGRTSAMNIATTALVGALGGVVILDEQLVWLHAAALVAVLTGTYLLSTHGSATATPGG